MKNSGVPAGSAVQAAFAARGHKMSIEEARRFAETMIELIRFGVVVPEDRIGMPADLDEED